MTSGADDPQRSAVVAEASRIHESAVHSAQGQLEAAKGWRGFHWLLGLATALLSAAAAVLTFASVDPVVPGVLAVLSALVAAALTCVRPDQLSLHAQRAGNEYLALRNESRRFRDIAAPADPLPELREAIGALSRRESELNLAADTIPRWAYRRAKRNIEKDGGQSFEVDAK